MSCAADCRTDSVLPPYGNLPSGFDGNWDVPLDWEAKTPDVAQEVEEWGKASLAMISAVLWPVWATGCGWCGESASRIEVLTKADLELLLQIRKRSHERPFDTLPRSPLRHLESLFQRDFFSIEDDPEKFQPAERYRSYDRELDPGTVGTIPLLFRRFDRKIPVKVIFQFKRHLQRPRPYQTALIMGREEFTHAAAKTALHPSMISGHCIQGIMGAAAVFDRILSDNSPWTDQNKRAMRQFGVDFGDRRVMAGVHYPSDNLASWVLALDLCDRVCRNPGVKTQLWLAIKDQSLVYRKLAESGAGDTGSPFKSAWDELHRRAPALNPS